MCGKTLVERECKTEGKVKKLGKLKVEKSTEVIELLKKQLKFSLILTLRYINTIILNIMILRRIFIISIN